MDNIIVSCIGAVAMLLTLVWPTLGRAWLHWPQTTIPVGWIARLGLACVWGFLVGVLLIADGAEANWWYCYAGLMLGVGLVTIGYYRDQRTAANNPPPS